MWRELIAMLRYTLFMLMVPTKALILVAALVWLAAGIGVVYVGVTAASDPWTGVMAIGFFIVFACFFSLFLLIARKQIRRINGYTDKLTSIFKFFDAQSYIIIAVMVFLGAAVRVSQLLPGSTIAFFYSGLGSALIASAIYYLVTYIAICEELIVHKTPQAGLQSEDHWYDLAEDKEADKHQ